MGLLASDDRAFYPIKCVKLPDGSWQHTPTTMTRTKLTAVPDVEEHTHFVKYSEENGQFVTTSKNSRTPTLPS